MRLQISRPKFLAAVAIAIAIAATRVAAISFGLGESKAELGLKYDVAVTDHGTGRVTIVFTIEDAGRLAPLDYVRLAIPSREEDAGGGHGMDLSVSIEMRRTDEGRHVGRVHILKEWAERTELWLNTHTMDGKADPLTGLYHVIRIADYLKARAADGEAR
jgi:hypothetical protein